ncbi:ABC transporter substrate-binding protein [Cellulomonas wangsupingiae]|uniref:ABC transporter substrate-binding protein n=1 Tax=Cellulomonas wangsupingiae TaxID=2968085 RepID=A0ABY5K3R6_9CELL|nr:ABC transporter substrate-binding protein [Cellulomonas wangsupingiae]MCC2333361.1 ABC transporter substrate-binding protein [Cellulomonas wangsupingiae]MCM0638214.1 ABC transporter substrate-binding protein [Cellulomonas wangsupingiae]UUI63561.1 ABC transporter substrate-binding protein [Cellulomonas wangsupingiae]
MNRSTRAGRALAVAGAVALVLTACSGGSDDAGAEETADGGTGEPLLIGTVLPVTGSLEQLGPPEIAGVDLAVQEINEAGGLFGADVEVQHTDSSDAKNASIATASAQELISAGVSAIIGAASSSVTLNIVDDITGAGIVQVSPANTATDLSGYADFYFRTAPPDSVQGDVLGNLMVGDGASNVGILVFNDSYGTSLRDVVEGVVTEAGGTVVYGTSGQEFDPDETNFATIVADAIAAGPDAIAILTFTDQTPPIVRELAAQGWDMSKTYFVDGNLENFGTDGATGFPAGTLENAQGTLPGAFPSEEFQARLLEVDPGLTGFSYGPEAYDATMLVALAALKGGDSSGETIQANMAAVSGADGGTDCTGWEECSQLLEDGEDIAYQAVSGVGPFNDANDPSSAFIGIYQFGADNMYTFNRSEEGEVPED